MTADHPDQPRRVLPTTLPGLNLVFIDDDEDWDDQNIGADFDADDSDCAFCVGREAAHCGESVDRNPYPESDARPGSIDWYETDYGLRLTGHGIGSHESQD